MSTMKNKDELFDLLNKSIVEIKDGSFTEEIIEKHVASKEERKFRLFWDSDLLIFFIATSLLMSIMILLIINGYSFTVNETPIEAEPLLLSLIVSFALIIFKYCSEYFQVKYTL